MQGEDAAPQQLPAVSDARPLEFNAPQEEATATLRFSSPASTAGNSAADGSLASGTVLRWKSRQSDAAGPTTGFSSRPAEGAWQDRTQKNGPPVMAVAHENVPGAFRDPFGDKAPASDAGLRLLSPTGTAVELGTSDAEGDAPTPPYQLMAADSPIQKPSVMRPGKTSTRAAEPGATQKPSADDTLPPLPPGRSYAPEIPFPKPSTDETPGPGAASGQGLSPAAPSLGPPSSVLENELAVGDASCQRVYNDRNCCDEDRKCATARQALRANSITKISLDITAPFKPDAATLEEELEAREGRLREMPARQWRDRTGKVVASGRLQGIRNRKITVAGEAGEPAELRLGELSDDDLCFLAAWWGVPTECTLGDDQFNPRAWDLVTMTWKASALCHKPLYFEEVGLERYGHSMGPVLEPVHSGAHFFLNVAFLPYKMGIHPPHECQYALGYYRPGNCAPWLVPQVPLSLRGALVQGTAALGVVYLLP